MTTCQLYNAHLLPKSLTSKTFVNQCWLVDIFKFNIKFEQQ